MSQSQDSASTQNFKPVRNDPYPPTPPEARRPVTFAPAATRRPRLLTTPEELSALKARLAGPVESGMFARLKERGEHFVKDPRLPAPGAPVSDRGFASGLAEVALLHALTGEKRYLDAARAQALALSRCNPASGKDPFSGSDVLVGMAWGYDWLHPHLTPAERSGICAFIRDFGSATFTYMVTPLGYWMNTPLHNVTINGWAGVGVAGLGFHDEFPEAREWALAAQRFFRTVSWLWPPDGGGLEGPQYTAYGFERKTMHYEAARRCLGEDLYGPGEARSGRWFCHLTKPNPIPKNNAFPWNDNGPYYDAHGPVYALLALARRFRDGRTQALALKLWRAQVGARFGLDWTNLLYYDPTVPETPWDEEPTGAHFEDLDMVAARSSWRDDATALSFCCGPYQGHRAKRVFSGDPGGSHQHAHAASFQLSSRGEDLLIDPGYEHIKRTSHHNTILVDGHGQLGEGIKWYNVNRVLHWDGGAEVLAYSDDGRAAAWVGEAARMYVAEARLKSFRRHVLYLRPDLVLVLDELHAAAPAVFTQLWHTRGELRELGGGAWGFTQGQAAFSLLPLSVKQGGGAAPQVSNRHQKMPDLSKLKDELFSELRVESPRAERWTFAAVLACGNATEGPPKLEASCELPRLVVTRGTGGPVQAVFSSGEAPAPPRLV